MGLKTLPSVVGTLAPAVRLAPKVADVVYRSREWRALAARVKRERGSACAICGSRDRVIADHVVEVRDGGAPYDASNLQLLCQAHHNAKTAKARAARASAST